jgi:Prokaryotic homologs of the JAB domain
MVEIFRSVPPTLRSYMVDRRLLNETAEALRKTGRGQREAAALWQGRILSHERAQVTKLIVPVQIAGALHFNIPLRERLRIVEEISKVGQFILIQLHTHPHEAFHSAADDRFAVTKHLGAISIVIPNFAMNWTGDLLETSIHFNLGGGAWRELSKDEVAQLFEVTD